MNKSSLLIALELMQNDYQQMCTSTKAIVENDGENNVELACETKEGNEVTQPNPSLKQPDINKHPSIEANTGKNRKSKRKQGKQIEANDENTNRSPETSADSMIKHLDSKRMQNGLQNQKVTIKTFPRARIDEMKH